MPSLALRLTLKQILCLNLHTQAVALLLLLLRGAN